MNSQQIKNLIEIMGKFKQLKRSGWLRHKVTAPESDAEHSFSLALSALLFAPKYLDKTKCLEMALIHALAEIYAGDYTPIDNITPKEKAQKEKEGIIKIAQMLEYPQMIELFDEFEQKNTKESIFVNALDKLDNVITASYYDQNNRSEDKLVPEFSAYARKKIDELGNNDMLQPIKDILSNLTNHEAN